MLHRNRQDFGGIALQNVVIQSAAADPGSPFTGQIYYNTVSNVYKFWTGAAWRIVILDNDARLTDSRTPTGAAGGDLAGTYPNPTIGANKVVLSSLALGLLESGVSSGTALTTDPALRKLGTGANDALAGNTPLNSIASPTGSVGMNSQKIINLLDPTGAQDAATKNYVDSVAQGLDVKPSVRVATTAAGTLASSFANTSVVDGITLATGDRILIKNQASAPENGIYTVNAAGAPTRATDFDAWSETPGAFVFVEVGTVNVDTGWVSTTKAGGTINTTAVNFVQFSSAGSYTAGNGLNLAGGVFTVVGTANRISVGAGGVDIAATYVGQASITTLGTITTGVWNGTAIPVANGGTGATTAAGARTNLGAIGVFATTNPTMVAGTYSTSINHGLARTTVHVMFTNVSTGEMEDWDWKVIDANNVQIRTDVAVTAGTTNVLVQG